MCSLKYKHRPYIRLHFYNATEKQYFTFFIVEAQEIINAMVLLVPFLLLALSSCSDAKRKNVLFITIDDLRPQLGAYEGPDFPAPVSPTMITPNIDRLAGRSLLMKRAHVQQAICSPSRTSILTGRRPDTTHVLDLQTYWRDTGGNFTTIPQYFKENGYYSVSLGKIFHPGYASDNGDPISWNEDPWQPPAKTGFWGTFGKLQSWFSVNDSMIEENGRLPDQQLGDRALRYLNDFSGSEKPFFMALGFYKPHLPFLVPEEFLDLYPMDNIKLPANPYIPSRFPWIAWSTYGELRDYPDIADLGVTGEPNTLLPDYVVKDLRRAYYASVSYVDNQIGRLLREIDALGIRNNTIIVLIGDHGWQLGEHGSWCKHTNFELSTHTPLMISAPGFTDNGIASEKLGEFVDIFPTLVDLAELPGISLCPEDSRDIKVCSEGVSMMPLIRDPTIAWKPRVFSQYPRNNKQVMGYSLRDQKYRYTEWVDYDEDSHTPNWPARKGAELYDHQNDPNENENLANDESMAAIRAQLSAQLHQGWRSALPTAATMK